MRVNVWPEVMAFLLDRTGLSAAEYAFKAGIATKTVQRIQGGKNQPGPSFDGIAKAADLTPGQLGYLYNLFLTKKTHPFRFEIDIRSESEVREPAPAYDPPTARERAENLLRFDMRQVPAKIAPSLTLIREQLRETLKELKTAEIERERRLSRLVELHENLFDDALHLYREIKALRDG